MSTQVYFKWAMLDIKHTHTYFLNFLATRSCLNTQPSGSERCSSFLQPLRAHLPLPLPPPRLSLYLPFLLPCFFSPLSPPHPFLICFFPLPPSSHLPISLHLPILPSFCFFLLLLFLWELRPKTALLLLHCQFPSTTTTHSQTLLKQTSTQTSDKTNLISKRPVSASIAPLLSINLYLMAPVLCIFYL